MDENRPRDRLREVLGDPGWSRRAWRDRGQQARKAAPSQRQRRWPWVAARVAAAVAVVAVPMGTGALSPAPASAAQRPTASPTVYAVFSGTASCEQVGCTGAVIPISTATNTPGKPIRPGPFEIPQTIAITP